MSDPFRNELGAAQEQLRRKDERIAELEAEKEALKRKLTKKRGSNAPYLLTGLAVTVFAVTAGVVYVQERHLRSAPPAVELAPPKPPVAFPREAALEALMRADLSACYTDNRTVHFHADVTFGPNGNVVAAVIDDPGSLQPAEVACVQRALLRDVTVPPFDGPTVHLGKTFLRQATTPAPGPNPKLL